MGIEGIPVVDFAKCGLDVEKIEEKDKKIVGDKVYEALATVGFVYLQNFGIKQEQLDEFILATRKFFDLDLETKEKYNTDENYHGYLGNERERLNPKRPGDLNEAYDATGPGMSSDDTLWPEDVAPGFKGAYLKLSNLCKELSFRLLEVIAIGMDIKDKDVFLKAHSRLNGPNNHTALRSLLYRPLPHPSKIKKNQIRLGEHSDFGSITLVFQDQVGGLEVQKDDGTYIEATPIPGTVLINVGDSLQYWTQGRLKATKHRIVLPKDKKMRESERKSIAYFAKANHECLLNEIEYGEKHRSHSHRPIIKDFIPMTVGEYVTMKVNSVLG